MNRSKVTNKIIKVMKSCQVMPSKVMPSKIKEMKRKEIKTDLEFFFENVSLKLALITYDV